jgi:heme/copper-type cytochrome/quinol oxidase subunit 2
MCSSTYDDGVLMMMIVIMVMVMMMMVLLMVIAPRSLNKFQDASRLRTTAQLNK